MSPGSNSVMNSTPHKKRRFQFGLRSFLVLVTVAGALLSWVAAEFHRARQVRQVVAEVRGMGGEVSFRRRGFAFLTRSDEYFSDITEIRFFNNTVTDAKLAHLLPQVQRLPRL